MVSAQARHRPSRRLPAAGTAAPALVALGVVAVVIANAWGSAQPGVGFWDTGEFQTVLPLLGTAHPTGYPTYVLLGFVANILLSPLGEPAFRINVLALLSIATAAGLTVELVRRLTGSLAIAAATGLGLATTPVVWANATRADPHPLHLAFVALLLVLLVGWDQARRGAAVSADRWLVAAAVAFGLSVGNHSLTLLLAPPIGLYVLAVERAILGRPRFVAACAIAVVAAAGAVYLELPLRAGPFRAPLVYAEPDTWDGFWYIALAEQFRGSFSDPLADLPGKLADLWDLAVLQYGVLAALVPVGFIATLRRAPRYALLTGTAMIITVGFNASYTNADINRYYLGPVLWAWIWIAVLAAVLLDAGGMAWVRVTRRVDPARSRAGASPGAPSRRVAGALAVGLAVALLLPTVADLEARRQAAGRQDERAAQAWLDEVLPALAADAVVVSWWSTSTPLWYAELVEGRRTDLEVIDDRTVLDRGYGTATTAIAAFLGRRPVYVIRANAFDLALVKATYRLQQVAGADSLAVYEVLGPAAVAGRSAIIGP